MKKVNNLRTANTNTRRIRTAPRLLNETKAGAWFCVGGAALFIPSNESDEK